MASATLVSSSSLPLFLFFFIASFFSAPYCPKHFVAATSQEAQALLLFKHGISGDPLGLLDSWTIDPDMPSAPLHPYCHGRSTTWAGISCDAQQLHVVTINLRSCSLSGTISSSLALLHWLSVLDLSDNHLSGQLPASLFGGAYFASTLQYLNLSFNSLEGNLPQALGNLSALTQLDLSHNLFKGALPASIWHLPKLQLLWLESPGGTNPLGASLPVGSFGFCSTIKDFRLRSLALAGQIPPSLSQCKQLQYLVLVDNGLQGTIPQAVWQLPALRVLYLVETVYAAGLQMEPVPESLSFCPTITQLWFQGFNLTPASTPQVTSNLSLGDCKQLESLILYVGGSLQAGLVTPGVWQLPRLQVLTWVDIQVKDIIDASTSGLTRPFQVSASLPETFGFCSTITHLQIAGINLTGEIPPSLGSCEGLQYLELSHGSLEGAIPATVRNLTQLQGLSFASNYITGGIPAWIGNLSELQALDLGDNPLSGSLPAELGQLKQLQMLSLYTTNLSDPAPEALGNCTELQWLDLGSYSTIYINQVGFPKSLGNLKNLRTLAWRDNVKAPSDALMQALCNFTLLEYLAVSTSSVSGVIPPQAGDRLPHLSYIDLSVNEITGPIPPQLGNLTALAFLNLGYNHLEGSLPYQLVSLSSHLQHCSLAGNNLSGSIPPWLGQFQKLDYLDLSSNQFTGSIPHEFLASLSDYSTITILYLDNNKLQGYLPGSIGGLEKLQDLYLQNNQLEGIIPRSLGNCSALQNLLLSNNSLTGEIPKELGNLVNLNRLDMSTNRLVGHIPTRALENCSGLQILRLFDNHLTGGITDLNISRMESLQTLTIQKNLLVGRLPAFTNSTSLQLVDFGNNGFDGEIPSSSSRDVENLSALSSLRVLSMASNRLSGAIPDWVWSLPILQLLDLSDNLFTGHMPHTFAHLEYLKNSSSTKINDAMTLYEEVPVTLKDSTQVLSYILNSRMLIDLSANALEGRISESLGELIGLTSLNLSHNHITGIIPPSLSSLSQLESLDVSNNNLTGGIPKGLGALGSLSAFSVADNQLQGQIPTLDNFNTRFDNSSFIGNPGLCGFPLSKQCHVPLAQGNKTTNGLSTTRGNSFQKWLSANISLGGFLLGYPLGIFVGLCFAYLAFKSCMCYRDRREKVIKVCFW